MKILTYNIHKGVGGRDRAYRLHRIVRVLEDLQPDVACLQEVTRHARRSRSDDQPALLALAGPLVRWFQMNVHYRQGGYGNLLLSRWPIVERHSLSLRIGERKPRAAQLAVLDRPEGHVLVGNFHLGLSAKERSAQIARLLAHPLISASKVPCVLAGDTNDWRGLLKKAMLGEGFAEATQPPSRHRTFPAWMPVGALDKVYCRGDLAVESVRVVRTALTRQASDHLPVLATLRVEEQP